MNNLFSMYENLTENGADIKNLEKIRPATFYKYLELFKKTGFQVIKYKTVHKIITYSNSIKLSDAEEGLIAYLKLLSNMLFSKNKNKIFIGLIEKMMKLTDKKTEENTEEKFLKMKNISDMSIYKEKLHAFEKYKKEKQNIEILLKNKTKMVLKPNTIIHKNKKIYCSFLDNKNDEVYEIDINKIVSLTPVKNYSILEYHGREIVFELYGRLAKIYQLKEGETVIDFSKDKLTVANRMSDKKALFRRLLRYDTLCKVKYPKEDALEFENLIKKSLENINSIKDNIL